jgi:hypothetical protein
VSLTLHLGFVDVPYADVIPGSVSTTGDVAEILEAEYHIVENFYELKQGQISDEVELSLTGALESMLQGAPPTIDAFGEANGAIQQMFKVFLTSKEMEAMAYPGVPTQAALDGVNHRLLHPYAKANPRRPSFIDTGLYENSFISWVD